MRGKRPAPAADESSAKSRRRAPSTRTRESDKWTWKDGLHAFGIVGAVLAGVGGIYWSVETRLGTHDMDIGVLKVQLSDQRQFTRDMLVSLEKISLQLTDIKVTAASRGR